MGGDVGLETDATTEVNSHRQTGFSNLPLSGGELTPLRLDCAPPTGNSERGPPRAGDKRGGWAAC